MLFKLFRLFFGLLGFLTGLTVVHTMIIGLFPDESFWKYPLYGFFGLASALFMYYISGRTFLAINKLMGKAQHTATKLSFYDMLIGGVGLIAGLVIANLAAIPFRNIDIIGGPLAVVLNILLGMGGMYFAISKKDEISLENFKANRKRSGSKILDTCAIIDGRIMDVFETGFLDGLFVVPLFIVKELHTLADSGDPMKRSRGKRGLEILEKLKEKMKSMDIVETEFDDLALDTDVKLMKYASKTAGAILTVDYNLNKVAAVTGIRVLNINDLANSVKRMTLPGEEIKINIVKKGKENGQGIGYLEDGTMVVADKGNEFIGMDVELVVTSVMQTSAGRLVFARVK
ncbi:MAG: PIN/TRAM domain-containing protein [Clostridia bacterium]